MPLTFLLLLIVIQQNFGSMEASRLVNNIDQQLASLNDRYSINDNSKEGNSVFHPRGSGPSHGGIGHKPSPPRDIPKGLLESLQPPLLNHKYSINDDKKDVDDFFRPTDSGPSGGGEGHKQPPQRAIPRILLQSPQPPSLDHHYSINDDNKDSGDVFLPTSSLPSDGGIGHKPPSLDHMYSINDSNKDGGDFFHPINSGPSDGGRGHKSSPPRAIPRI